MFRFNRREPMTPAQQKLIAACVILVVIFGASLAIDVVSGRDRAEGPGQPPAAESVDGDTDDAGKGERLEAEEDDGFETLADGEAKDCGDFYLTNSTGEDAEVPVEAMTRALTLYFGAAAIADTTDATLQIAAIGDGHGSVSYYLVSDRASFRFLRVHGVDVEGLGVAAFDDAESWASVMPLDGIDESSVKLLSDMRAQKRAEEEARAKAEADARAAEEAEDGEDSEDRS